MRLKVERAPSPSRVRLVSRRRFLIVCGSTSSIVLMAACQRGAAPPAPATQEPAAIRTREAINTPQAASAAAPATSAPAAAPQATSAPVAAAPASAPTTAPVVAQPGPKGKFVEGWQSGLTPAWNDPQENPPQITPYNFQLALHDALVKHMPGKPFAPSLAESYEFAPDAKSATFKLRQGIKFHDGKPVTPEDVKFTFEKYRGANAGVLKEKTEKVE